jgi:hypothetical protein
MPGIDSIRGSSCPPCVEYGHVLRLALGTGGATVGCRGRGRAGGPHGGVRTRATGHPGHRLRSRSPARRWDLPDCRTQRLPGGHRGAPLPVEGPCRGAVLAGDAGRRPARASAVVAHLLPRAVPEVPAAVLRHAADAGAGRSDALRALLLARAPGADCRSRHARRLADEPVRAAPLRDLLQELQREGLGHALLGDCCRLGGAAGAGPLAGGRGRRGVAPPGAAPRGPPRHQDAGTGVQLSAPRPRHDVGGVRLARSLGRWRDPPGGAM